MAEKHEESPGWGRIFMSGRISVLDEVEQARSRAWSEEDEKIYLEKVRLRAEEKARDILSAAEQKARALREKAVEEGRAEGLRLAQEEMNELRASMAQASHSVLSAMEERGKELLETWKEDLPALLRLAVEKALGMALSEDRAALLSSLYTQAARALTESRRVLVRCNPEDAAAVEDIIAAGREKLTEQKGWSVRADETVPPGDLWLESESSLAQSSLESRRAAVMQALEGLRL
ncbi:MAG: flagellar assembly protein FliH [Deltaproteobacteria bacterium]|jgi:flagellar assembly protein FliH|nr:flagellar assembly protein FliH [Deltaproteobacteria bacterium]